MQALVRDDAPWCPCEHRVHPPHQRPRRRRRVRDIVFDAELPRARPRRRVPRRAGGDAGRSAPSARHDEVQPGAHVDAGERGRHRRRLPVHLRHGRARAATSSSAAPCQVWNTFGAAPRASTAGQPWLLRFFDQIRFFPVSADELAAAREAFPHGALHRADRGQRLPARRLSPLPRQQRRLDRRVQIAPAAPPSPPSASAGATSASTPT